jgi:hypothetical protein
LNANPHYEIHRANAAPPIAPDWNHPSWSDAETLQVTHFLSEGSDHRPRTSARLLYDSEGIHGIFQVHDRYVACVRTNYFDDVWKDSCVEFFAQPKPGFGYFNFEFNCGAAFLCCYIVNPERTPDGFKEFTRLPASIGTTIQARSSLPALVDPEIVEPTTWTLRFFIPFALFERYIGALGPIGAQVWRGNFFKCGDEGSHPHWGSWSPVDQFNFHRPNCFGILQFV